MTSRPDEFLSEEDRDIRNMTDEELSAWWLLWLRLAQSTNEVDAGGYSHGVFDWDPAVPRFGGGAAPGPVPGSVPADPAG